MSEPTSTDHPLRFATRVNVGDSLTRTAARSPHKIALVEGSRRLTYRSFDELVNRFAHALQGASYVRGDALALASGNSVEFLVTYYACAKTGVVCVPVNLGWRPSEVSYVLGHSRARGLVVEAQLVDALEPALLDAPDVVHVVVAPGTGAAARAARRPDPRASWPATPRSTWSRWRRLSTPASRR